MEPDPQAYEPTVITVKATVNSMGIYLSYKERYKETVQIQKIETIIEKEVNVLKWWQKNLMALGLIAITILLSETIIKLSKILKFKIYGFSEKYVPFLLIH